MKKTRLVLIDSNAIVHRAYHAIPTLTNKNGELLNSVYGFSLIFLNMIRDLKPTHIAATFDVAKKTFRHKMYVEYKAKRAKKPDEFYEQIPKIKTVLDALKVPIYELGGYEADDIIATISKTAYKNVDEIIIVTGDLDNLQLVNDKVKVWTMKRGITDTVLYDTEKVKERYGFGPEALVEYKGLYGDTSDNIPGVAGIGEKSATELIKKYQTIENVYKNIDRLSPRYQKLLKAQKEQSKMSKELAQMVDNVKIKFDLEKCRFGKFNRQDVLNIFQNFEFKSLISKIPQNIQTEPVSLFSDSAEENLPSHKNKYQLVSNESEFKDLIAKLSKSKVIAFDTETDCLDMITGRLLGISFAWKKGKACYVPWKLICPQECHSGISKKYPESIRSKSILDSRFCGNDKKECRDDNYIKIKNILEDSRIKKIGHNLKYDWSLLYRYGIDTGPLYFDTMIASYLLNTQSRAHGLDNTAFVELGYEMQPIEDLIGKGKNQKKCDEIEVEKLAQYSAEDADMTFQLYEKFAPRIIKEKLSKLFDEIEMPLIKVLAQMELIGVKLNEDILKDLNKKVSAQITGLRSDIYKNAGSEFNINSTKQLQKILFDDLKISTDAVKKTKTGHSTAAAELEKLKGTHKIIDLIHKYRELTKIKNTYLDALPKLARPRHLEKEPASLAGGRREIPSKTKNEISRAIRNDKRIHTSFNQTITTSGRLSSSDPNLQNIPIRTDLGQEIRNAFTAEKGKEIVAFDYSQIELRIAAHFSNDEKMIKAFENKQDIHSATASLIFNKPIAEISKSERRVAKTVNFGILYGISAYGLSQNLGNSREEAQDLIDRYFNSFKGVKKYCDLEIERARKTSYVETMFGHRRYLPDINSSVFNFKNAAERMAVNHPIQGTAAEIMKLAMIKLAEKNLIASDDCKLVLQVHDELVFEITKDKIKEYREKIKTIMENIVQLKIPLVVDCESGKSWGELSAFAKGEAGVPARALRDAGK